MSEDNEQIAEETGHVQKRVRKPKLKVMKEVPMETPKVEVPSKAPTTPAEKPKTISVGAEFNSYTINDALAKALGPGHFDVVDMDAFKAALRRREDTSSVKA